MRRTFKLTFPTKRGNFAISVEITKSFTERISFRTGYRESEDDKPQLVKYIKVVPKDPNLKTISSRKHIAHVCTANELLSLYPTGEEDSDGEDEYVIVDKTSLKNLFPGSDVMEVIRTVPAEKVPFNYLTNKHYFLNVKKVKRKADPEDIAMYKLVYEGLKYNNDVLIVRYTSMNTNKHAVIYSSRSGLHMTNIIASNYQKTRVEKQELDDQVNLSLYKRLVKSTKQTLNLREINDDYALKLEELVHATLTGEKIEPKKEEKYKCFAKLATLENDSDSDDDRVPKRKLSRKTCVNKKKKVCRKKPDESSDSDSDSE